MSSLSDSSHQYSSLSQTFLKGVVKSAILKLQKNFMLYPQKICLISGAPRSGTTALCEWIGCQNDVSAFHESRILISIHRFMEEINRFRNLEKDSAIIVKLSRKLVFNYYATSRVLIRKRLLVDKEPLEPIAFPSKEYEQFITNIKSLFPEVKLLLAIRDPIATIWSMQGRTWGNSLTNTEARSFSIDDSIENWCSCANLVVHHCSDPNTYVVQFRRLINDSENESKRIFDFLNIRKGESFRPHQTNEIGFGKEEREKILRLVQSQLDLLNSHGISDLF